MLFLPGYPEISDKTKKSYSAHEIQQIMFENIDKVKYDDSEKLEIIKRLLRLKLEQNPYVKKKNFTN